MSSVIADRSLSWPRSSADDAVDRMPHGRGRQRLARMREPTPHARARPVVIRFGQLHAGHAARRPRDAAAADRRVEKRIAVHRCKPSTSFTSGTQGRSKRRTPLTATSTSAPATMPASASTAAARALPSTPPMPGDRAGRCAHASIQWCRAGDAVRQDAAADQEHRRGAGDRQGFIRYGAAVRMPPADAPARAAPVPAAQVQPGVVELDDAGDQPVDADRHEDRDADQHRDLRRRTARCDGAERDRDDLGRQDEVGAHRALDLVLLERDQVDRRVGQPRARQLARGALRLPARCAGTCARASRSPRSTGTRRRSSAAASPPRARRR